MKTKKFKCIKSFSATRYNPDREEVGFENGKIYEGEHFFKEDPEKKEYPKKSTFITGTSGVTYGISGKHGTTGTGSTGEGLRAEDFNKTWGIIDETYKWRYRGGRNGYIIDSGKCKIYFGYERECDEHFAAVHHLNSYFVEV